MVEKWSLPYPAHTGPESRSVYVYLPQASLGGARFPVLYMFDGHNVFFDEDATYGVSWGMEAYMDKTGTPMMIVAVECNHSPDNGRLSEYSPFSFEAPRLGRIVGRGQATMDWFTQQLKPLIDSHYPTLPDREHTFIAGSSMGGLMSLYAVLSYNEVFSRAAALSPSLWVAPRKLTALIDEAQPKPGTVIYMDYGAKELRARRHMRRSFGRTAQQLIDKRVLLTSRIIPHGEHSEASWSRQIPFFMNTLTYE